MNDIIMRMNTEEEKKDFDVFFDDWKSDDQAIAIDFDHVKFAKVSFNYYDDSIQVIFDVKDDLDVDWSWGFGFTRQFTEYNYRLIRCLMSLMRSSKETIGVAFVKIGGSRMVIFHAK